MRSSSASPARAPGPALAGRPAAARRRAATARASAGVWARTAVPAEAVPDWRIARWNSGWAAGMASSREIFRAPPDWPTSVTLPGSPPKAAILSLTHSRAATMSSWPTLPEAA